jgi:hypothetical protein
MNRTKPKQPLNSIDLAMFKQLNSHAKNPSNLDTFKKIIEGISFETRGSYLNHVPPQGNTLIIGSIIDKNFPLINFLLNDPLTCNSIDPNLQSVSSAYKSLHPLDVLYMQKRTTGFVSRKVLDELAVVAKYFIDHPRTTKAKIIDVLNYDPRLIDYIFEKYDSMFGEEELGEEELGEEEPLVITQAWDNILLSTRDDQLRMKILSNGRIKVSFEAKQHCLFINLSSAYPLQDLTLCLINAGADIQRSYAVDHLNHQNNYPSVPLIRNTFSPIILLVEKFEKNASIIYYLIMNKLIDMTKYYDHMNFLHLFVHYGLKSLGDNREDVHIFSIDEINNEAKCISLAEVITFNDFLDLLYQVYSEEIVHSMKSDSYLIKYAAIDQRNEVYLVYNNQFVRKFIREGVDPRVKGHSGNYLITGLAYSNDYFNLLYYLIKQQLVELDQEDYCDPLNYSAEPATIRILFADSKPKYYTPLEISLITVQYKIISLLLTNGAKFSNIQNTLENAMRSIFLVTNIEKYFTETMLILDHLSVQGCKLQLNSEQIRCLCAKGGVTTIKKLLEMNIVKPTELNQYVKSHQVIELISLLCAEAGREENYQYQISLFVIAILFTDGFFEFKKNKGGRNGKNIEKMVNKNVSFFKVFAKLNIDTQLRVIEMFDSGKTFRVDTATFDILLYHYGKVC